MRNAIFILLITSLAGCRTQELLPSDYVNWFRDADNGLRQSKVINGTAFTVQYKSAEFMALQELRSDELSETQVKGTLEKYGELEYYNYEIAQDNGYDLLDDERYDAETVAQRIEYLLSYAQSDFQLITEHDTSECILYHFERSYSLSPVTTLVLAFSKPKTATDDRTIVYYDQLKNSGPVRISVSASAINNLPGIIYSHE